MPILGGGFVLRPIPLEERVRQLQRVDVELYRLYAADLEYERSTQSVAARIREAPSAEARDALMQELRELVAKHFEVRQERRRLQLRRLEEELARTRQAIEARQEARDALIDRRIRELTGDQPLPDF
ncbi:MAG: hypothetical protein KatS3mg109_0251 [Pirellulaceae bacterium]|nr:MAG: hypothetical protein KatS3mg109_0251 [Pirellulaceae bacterium]